MFSGPEYGTTEAAWRGCLVEAESVADVHTTIRDSLMNNVQAQILAWKKENYHKPMVGPCKETKQLEDEFKKVCRDVYRLLSIMQFHYINIRI